MNWLILVQKLCFSLVFIVLWRPASSEYLESIYWSPLNDKFHFSEVDFKNNQAFLTKFVSRQSNINIICPNVATVFSTIKQQTKVDSLYENIWMVRKEDFYSCKINKQVKDNQILHLCNQPKELSFYNMNFSNVYNSKQASLSSIYLIATSNGSKQSLNQTSGGHCKSDKEGFSLRIKFTFSDSSSSDLCNTVKCLNYAVCKVQSNNPVCVCNKVCIEIYKPVCGSNSKTYSNECFLGIDSCTNKKHIRVAYQGRCLDHCNAVRCANYAVCKVQNNKTVCVCNKVCIEIYKPVCGSNGKTYSNECFLGVDSCTNKKDITVDYQGKCVHQWEVLAICLGVAMGVSLLINIILVCYLCIKRNRTTKTKTSEEPMKTLIVEPPKKHGRVSAAL